MSVSREENISDGRQFPGRFIVRPQELPERLAESVKVWQEAGAGFPMRLNSHVLSMIKSADDPIARQFLPQPLEIEDAGRNSDPLCEEHQSPAPQVIHRYPHRVVLLVSNQCAVHCRFCMRKRRVAGQGQVPQQSIESGLEYIRSNSAINEVILSGGDPLMLGDDRLSALMGSLRRIPHIAILRLHTRMPAVWPQRISEALVQRLSGFHPLYINLHFNHPLELGTAAITACRRLADAGIPLGSQTVLLKGINDTAEVLHELMHKLLVHRIRPYYLHQLDRVQGTAHFRVPLSRALTLLESLSGRLSGLAVPRFMVDLPGGGGKVTLAPEVIAARQEEQLLLRNWQGKLFAYPGRE